MPYYPIRLNADVAVKEAAPVRVAQVLKVLGVKVVLVLNEGAVVSQAKALRGVVLRVVVANVRSPGTRGSKPGIALGLSAISGSS